MTVGYEWDVEEIDQHGDVVEHWFQSSYADCLKFIAGNKPDDADGRFDIVLVKTTDDGRGWCYLNGYGELPERFGDAEDKFFGAVPKPYIHEVRQAHANDVPIWITVDGGDLFEGHQGHWADTFFSNVTEAEIIRASKEDPFFRDCKIEIRPMTAEELERHPEAIEFRKFLITEYGTP